MDDTPYEDIMYAILHIPTGNLVKRAANYCYRDYRPAWYPEIYLFYSKKDAEAYKRKFLKCLYFSHAFYRQMDFTQIPLPGKVSFLKRNYKNRICLEYGAFEVSVRSIGYDFIFTALGAVDAAHASEPAHLPGVIVKEFLIIKI